MAENIPNEDKTGIPTNIRMKNPARFAIFARHSGRDADLPANIHHPQKTSSTLLYSQ